MRSVPPAPCPIHAGVKERSLSLLKNGPRAKVELLNERRVSPRSARDCSAGLESPSDFSVT